MNVPIRNLYYLLSYAFDVVQPGGPKMVGLESVHRVQDLLARLLASGLARQLRAGLHRDYQPRTEEVAGLKGRLELAATLRRNLLMRARTVCTFDEFEYDTQPNRVVKAAA